MDQSERDQSIVLESLIPAEIGELNPDLLRRFAIECCRRISNLFSDSIFSTLLEFAEERVSGSTSHDQLSALRYDATRLYDMLYPGYGTPSATALALTAVGEAAFTESPLKAALNASSTAAMAVASSSSVAADDDHYDDVHENAYRNERQAQLELLRKLDFKDGSQ